MGRLIMFYGTECKHCHEMMPFLAKLEEETGLKTEQLETWHDSGNKALLDKYDAGKCGGVPFFYNEDTEAWICGATTYEKIKEWATGKKAA